MLQLHFSFIHSNLHRQEYWAKLSSCLPKLTTSEYKTFSQANMLQQRQETYKTLKSDIQTQMLEYGSQKAISFLNKRVGVNNELAK